VIRRWVDATDVRTRLFDPQGSFFADSQTLDGPNGTSIDWRLLPPPHSFNTRVEAFIDFLSRQLNTWPGRGTLPKYLGDDRTAPPAGPGSRAAAHGQGSRRRNSRLHQPARRDRRAVAGTARDDGGAAQPDGRDRAVRRGRRP